MNGLSYSLGDSGEVLHLSEVALRHMIGYVQTERSDAEAGGQLFASIIKKEITIVQATGPSIEDQRSRFGFKPSRKKEQRDILKLHAEGLDFVGDWHTHPQDIPRPSKQDIASIKDVFRKSDHELEGIVLVILGRNEPPEGLYVGVCNGVDLIPLKALD